MAARPLRVCEVAEDLHKSQYGDKMDKYRRETIISGYGYYYSESNQVRPSEIHPPTLAKLQLQAISAGYSAKGEMFSARALAQLAKEQQSTYDVQLIKHALMNTQTGPSLSLIDLDDGDEEGDFAPLYIHRPRDKNTDAEVANVGGTIVERLIRGDLIAVW